jgi:hypothetical protein
VFSVAHDAQQRRPEAAVVLRMFEVREFVEIRESMMLGGCQRDRRLSATDVESAAWAARAR